MVLGVFLVRVCLSVCFIFCLFVLFNVALVDWYSFGGCLNCGMCYVVG